jgi:hypothetical protein
MLQHGFAATCSKFIVVIIITTMPKSEMACVGITV